MITYVVTSTTYEIGSHTTIVRGAFSSMDLANEAIALWSEGKGYGTDYSVTEFVLDEVE